MPNKNTSYLRGLLLEILQSEKLVTADELITLAMQRCNCEKAEAIKALAELEKEEKIEFENQKRHASGFSYIFSTTALWYWLALTMAIIAIVFVFTIPDDAYPVVYLRQVFGLFFIIFLPGYVFLKTLYPTKAPIFPSKEYMDNAERMVLSIVMSMVFVALTGLVLNYTPWGIGLISVTLGLFAFTVVAATFAIIREAFHFF